MCSGPTRSSDRPRFESARHGVVALPSRDRGEKDVLCGVLGFPMASRSVAIYDPLRRLPSGVSVGCSADGAVT